MRHMAKLGRWALFLSLVASCAHDTGHKFGASYGGGGSSSSGSGLTAIADQTTLCNVSGSSAIPIGCTATQQRTLLGVKALPLALTDLATQADQTFVGNVVGSTAAPVALTKAQSTTLLLSEYSTILGAAATTLTVASTNGDVDGDYRVECELRSAAASNAMQFAINGSNSNLKAFTGDLLNGGVARSDWNIARAGLSPMTFASGDVIYAWGMLNAKSGHIRQIHLVFYFDLTADDGGELYGVFTDTASNITSFAVTSSQASGINTGSFCKLTAAPSAF